MTTLTVLRNHTGMQFDPHLDVEDPVPVLTENQAQGDIYIFRIKDEVAANRNFTPFPKGQVAIVEGQGIRNPHTLIDLDGKCEWSSDNTSYQFDVGTLRVPQGEQCFMIHPEHGGSGIGEGTYIIRRQREFGEVIRAVED